MSNISQETLEFVKLFKPVIEEEIIPWNGNDAVGLSILRNYPVNGKFIPAKNKNGEDDSVALIKIGYLVSNEDQENNGKRLTITISKASRFLLKGNFDFIFNKENKDSPDEASLKESKSSKQPIDLEENSRYELNIRSQKIKDLDKNKYIEPKELVDTIYNLHLKTLSFWAVSFRMKMGFQKGIIDLITPVNRFLKALNYHLFGRTMRKTDNFALGIFDPYSRSDLIASTTEKQKFFNSDFPITNQSARTFVIVILAFFILNYLYNYDFFGFVKLSNEAAKNQLFEGVFILALISIFDWLFPNAILILINLLIKINVRLMKVKIKFK